MAFFTPTPESHWARAVVGYAHEAHPAVEEGGGQPGGIEERAAADGNAKGMAADWLPPAGRRASGGQGGPTA